MKNLLCGLTINLVHLVTGTKPRRRVSSKVASKPVKAMTEIQNATKGILDITSRVFTTFILISLTGGLYLFWIGLKIMVGTCKYEHKKAKRRRQRA